MRESDDLKIADIIEMVRFEFRRYGFRADGGQVVRNTNGLQVEFDQEPATGHAAFTQEIVYPRFHLWVSDLPMDQATGSDVRYTITPIPFDTPRLKRERP